MIINQIPQKSKLTFTIETTKGRKEYEIKGRHAQTLFCLCCAEKQGITALEVSSWALRLASYIHKLRHKYKIDIVTIKEDNASGFGNHARYRLLSHIEIQSVTYKGKRLL